MIFCSKCGNRLPDDASFCGFCGNAIQQAAPTPQQSIPTPQPQAMVSTVQKDSKELEQEFLDTTYRILRWERKAYRISGIVLTILGVVLFSLYFLLGIIYMFLPDELIAFSGLFVFYAFLFLFLYTGQGIINLMFANKIPQYFDTLYSDFRITNNRCGSIGMLVVSILFGSIGVIFFIINFARIKANPQRINSIIARQLGR